MLLLLGLGFLLLRLQEGMLLRSKLDPTDFLNIFRSTLFIPIFLQLPIGKPIIFSSTANTSVALQSFCFIADIQVTSNDNNNNVIPQLNMYAAFYKWMNEQTSSFDW